MTGSAECNVYQANIALEYTEFEDIAEDVIEEACTLSFRPCIAGEYFLNNRTLAVGDGFPDLTSYSQLDFEPSERFASEHISPFSYNPLVLDCGVGVEPAQMYQAKPLPNDASPNSISSFTVQATMNSPRSHNLAL